MSAASPAEAGRTLPETASDVRALEDHALFYVDPARAAALAFLTRPGDQPVNPSELAALSGADLDAVRVELDRCHLRVAVADVTAPDAASGPFRVARALGVGVAKIEFGSALRRLGNDRLGALLGEGEPNPVPHPLA
jgi:hypothetical protein